MPLVLIQPASNPDARRHFVNTIENRVPLGRIQPHIPANLFATLSARYEEGYACVWGVRPRGRTPWLRIQPGDVGGDEEFEPGRPCKLHLIIHRTSRWLLRGKSTCPMVTAILASTGLPSPASTLRPSAARPASSAFLTACGCGPGRTGLCVRSGEPPGAGIQPSRTVLGPVDRFQVSHGV